MPPDTLNVIISLINWAIILIKYGTSRYIFNIEFLTNASVVAALLNVDKRTVSPETLEVRRTSCKVTDRLLSGFKQILIFSTEFQESPKYQTSWKYCKSEPRDGRTDRKTGGHDKSNRSIS